VLNIFKLGKVLSETNRLNGIKEFNASVPIKIEVLKEINPITYEIKLGNKIVETKSNFPLKTGGKYLANIVEKKEFIQIQNLKEFPKLLDILEKLPKIKEINLDKNEILNKLQNSQTKNEFMFYANILLAFQKGIRHIFINEEKNRGLLQYKYEKNHVKFYACYKFLGELEGIITPNKVTVFTQFKNVASLISENKDIDLDVEVYLKEKIKPLFEFKNSLIDIKA
jgi:hypothetical protein